MKDKKNLTVKFDAPFAFEGQSRESMDLNGLYGLTMQDMADAQNEAMRKGSGAGMTLPETSTAVLMALAAKATGEPIELFQMMPKKAGRAVKNEVQRFLMDEVTPEAMQVQLETPLKVGDKTVEMLDLSAIANMKTIQLMEAEERMASKGLVYSEPMTSYSFAVALAAVATGIPEGAILQASIRDGVAIKAAVTKDFFG